MKRTFARVNDWMTDPDHNRVLPVLIFWTTITAALTVLFIQIHQPVQAAVWAVLTFVNVLSLIRGILE